MHGRFNQIINAMAYRTITITLANGQTKIKRIDERGIVPAGGTTGQKLGKLSDDNFDVDWMDDNGSVLTSDMIDAIQYSNNPSAANVFATMNDIPADELTSDQIDAIAYANDPSMFNVFATIDDVSGMAAGNGLTNNDGTIELGGVLEKTTAVRNGVSVLQFGNDDGCVSIGSIPSIFFVVDGISAFAFGWADYDTNDTLWITLDDSTALAEDIYYRTGFTGDIVPMGLSVSGRYFNAIAAGANGDVYIYSYGTGGNKVWKLDGGVAPLIDLNLSIDMAISEICVAPNGDIYAVGNLAATSTFVIVKYSGGIWTTLESSTSIYWYGIAIDSDGNIYATSYGGLYRGVYKQTAGIGSFVLIDDLNFDTVFGITVAPNGDVYAVNGNKTIYVMVNGTNKFLQTPFVSPYAGHIYHITSASNGEIYAIDSYRIWKKPVDARGMIYGDDYSALNVDDPRWIPDQGRVADMIDDLGVLPTFIAAMDYANSPSGSNPFATMADVGGGGGSYAAGYGIDITPGSPNDIISVDPSIIPSAGKTYTAGDGIVITPGSPDNIISTDLLSADELAAIQNANAPNASNPFATMDDIPTIPTIETYVAGDGIVITPGSPDNIISLDYDGRFGSGADGDVSISSEITLSRNMEYNNLTITTGGRLKTNGFIVKVRNKLTITGNGLMGCFGINGQNGGPTSVGGAVVFNHNWNWPTHTGKGGNGGRPGAGGLVAASGGAGGSVALDNNNAPYIWRRGAGGGGGGYYGQSSGATVAQAGTAIAYGAAGGAGGNATTSAGSSMNFLYGGSGGGGGGVLELWAHTIDNENAVNGIICNGAPGGNGAKAGTEKSGNGGGGGGGCCIIYYHVETGNGLNGMPLSNGGAAGTGGNGGVSGSNGTALSLQI